MGISPREFWDMTHKEVFRAVEGYNEKLKREARSNAQVVTMLYNGIQVHVKNGRFKTEAGLFPELFDVKKVELTEEDHKMIQGYLKRWN